MSGGGGESESEFEINLAPIIDCFTVLIAYLLISASFISLGMVNVSVSASGDPSTVPPPLAEIEPPLVLALQLDTVRKLEIKLSGGTGNLSESYAVGPQADGNWDVDGIKAKINALKEAHPTLAEGNVSAEAAVQYKEIVKVIQAIKTILPKVFLAS